MHACMLLMLSYLSLRDRQMIGRRLRHGQFGRRIHRTRDTLMSFLRLDRRKRTPQLQPAPGRRSQPPPSSSTRTGFFSQLALRLRPRLFARTSMAVGKPLLKVRGSSPSVVGEVGVAEGWPGGRWFGLVELKKEETSGCARPRVVVPVSQIYHCLHEDVRTVWSSSLYPQPSLHFGPD